MLFTPISLGENNTSGTFSLLLDGSAHGLGGYYENMDAITMDLDGKLVVSTTGAATVNGAQGPFVAQDRDLIKLESDIGQPAVWSVFFAGASIGLTLTTEDLTGASFIATTGDLKLNTLGEFATLDPVTGGRSDIFSCNAGVCSPHFIGPPELVIGVNGIHVQFAPAAALLAAEGERLDGWNIASLKPDELKVVAGAAIDRYQLAGASSDELDLLTSLSFAIVDLPGSRLGETVAGTVIVDINAAGHGWFVDASPEDDREFDVPMLATVSTAAHDRIDLVTVVLHDLKHALSFGHSSQAVDLMHEALELGKRKRIDYDEPHSLSADEVFGEFGDELKATF